MPYYDAANLVTVTETDMINKITCGCENMVTSLLQRLCRGLSYSQSLPPACAEVSGASEVSCRPPQGFQELRNLTILKVKS
jgi:hypothetical protein